MSNREFALFLAAGTTAVSGVLGAVETVRLGGRRCGPLDVLGIAFAFYFALAAAIGWGWLAWEAVR